MNPYTCHYHPQIDAITKCDRYGKYLCLECKKVYHQVGGDDDAIGAIRDELCPDCCEKRKVSSCLISLLFIIIFLIVASIMVANFNNNSNNPFFHWNI